MPESPNLSFKNLKSNDAVVVIRIWNFLNTFKDCLLNDENQNDDTKANEGAGGLVSFNELCNDLGSLKTNSYFKTSNDTNNDMKSDDPGL